METFSPNTFGSMSLGRQPAEISNDLAVARRAMETGVWFHSSPTYNQGFTYMVLRLAFDENRARVPKLILKVRDANASLMRFEVEDSCRRLGIDGIDVAQLVSMDANPGNLIDQLRGNGGPLADELAALRQRGLIRNAVVFLTPQNSDAAVEACGNTLIDGVTLYWNLFQRDCSESAWAAIQEKGIPVLALRTLGGGSADARSAARAEALANLMREAGAGTVADLALRFSLSEPVIRTTIGGTSSLRHLEEYLSAAKSAVPLTGELREKALAIQAQ